MNRQLSISIIMLGVFVVGVAFILWLARGDSPQASSDAAAGTSTAQLVRPDSHVLSQAEGPDAPVLVEFLDFECEACRAAYPLVEQLRQDYDGQLTVVARYFPIPSHANAVNAAVAVEAAAQQGQFEAMYKRMYATQAEWGEQQESKADVFRGFAEELGLDMDAYDAAVADEATAERIARDYQDGIDLGVQGTPTFFLDGQLLQPQSEADFRDAIEAAIAD
ncbi:Periplasmic thiol:disulfide interchange protein DsbA [Serinicoccus hydrothermalis]|uniref:Periplasmic thiol:disulfide interchange protein DsbA n=1 Tax=Serinicoccus hydrothermalis TaxID=1758689 RepID=A0A1B1ND95_9MICO|nr:thioredoxin domain-containing protein [Serinicoccus hydrothermalis]ANS79361.1 Periplasmic thiol:disulfide interchange protein DsbA [Serinicoccus hydrothermalis]